MVQLVTQKLKQHAEESIFVGRKAAAMEKRYYTAASLRRSLDALEQRFQLDSAAFLEAHQADLPAVDRIPRFLRHSWASFYLDWKRMSDDDLGARVEREVAQV